LWVFVLIITQYWGFPPNDTHINGVDRRASVIYFGGTDGATLIGWSRLGPPA
jgi:hypothetical protein